MLDGVAPQGRQDHAAEDGEAGGGQDGEAEAVVAQAGVDEVGEDVEDEEGAAEQQVGAQAEQEAGGDAGEADGAEGQRVAGVGGAAELEGDGPGGRQVEQQRAEHAQPLAQGRLEGVVEQVAEGEQEQAERGEVDLEPVEAPGQRGQEQGQVDRDGAEGAERAAALHPGQGAVEQGRGEGPGGLLLEGLVAQDERHPERQQRREQPRRPSHRRQPRPARQHRHPEQHEAQRQAEDRVGLARQRVARGRAQHRVERDHGQLHVVDVPRARLAPGRVHGHRRRQHQAEGGLHDGGRDLYGTTG
ncbi:MAG: hypothetical protein EOO75_03995 [Myxococcales bacterium]|nr:MAG: hypothetical protein EOO75_03995 [Myxococcales bacterium]